MDFRNFSCQFARFIHLKEYFFALLYLWIQFRYQLFGFLDFICFELRVHKCSTLYNEIREHYTNFNCYTINNMYRSCSSINLNCYTLHNLTNTIPSCIKYPSIMVVGVKKLLLIPYRSCEWISLNLLMVKCGLNLYEEYIGELRVWNAIEMRYQNKRLSSH